MARTLLSPLAGRGTLSRFFHQAIGPQTHPIESASWAMSTFHSPKEPNDSASQKRIFRLVPGSSRVSSAPPSREKGSALAARADASARQAETMGARGNITQPFGATHKVY